MAVLDDVGEVSGFAAVQGLVIRALGDLAAPWGFFGARPGMTLAELRAHLGEPAFEDEATIEYEVPLDHPDEGPRRAHVLRLVMTSHSGPVRTIELAVTYYGTGDLAPAWGAVAKAVEDHLVGALGAPAKKRTSGWEWTRGEEQLWMLVKTGELQMSVSG